MTQITGVGSQDIQRVDILQMRDDKTIQALEPTTGIFADMLFFNPVDDNNTIFQMSGASSTSAGVLLHLNTVDANKDFGVQAKGTGVVDLKSKLQVTDGRIEVRKTSDDAEGSELKLSKLTGSPAIGDNINSIIFESQDDGANLTEYAYIEGNILSPTGGAENGQLNFYVNTFGDPDALNMSIGNGQIEMHKKLVTLGGTALNFLNVTTATSSPNDNVDIIGVSYTLTGAVTVTLPTFGAYAGKVFTIKDTGGNASVNNITIDTQGAELIDGAASISLSGDYESVDIFSDGINFFVK